MEIEGGAHTKVRRTLSRPWDPSGPPQDWIDKRRSARMEKVDALPEEWRGLVHEYGFAVINALRECGVPKPKHARHVIETILSELSPLRGGTSCQGPSIRRCDRMAYVPLEPTDGMIEASMATITGGGMTITKKDKHRLRLKAALAAATGAKHVIVR